MDQRDDLPFPRSPPEFQQLFPDEAKCAAHGKSSMGQSSALPCRRRSHRHSRCPALSQVPPRYGPDGWHRHGTQPYAVEHTLIWSPARRPASRRFSATGAMRRPSAFSTSSALAWCGPIRMYRRMGWWTVNQGSRRLCRRWRHRKPGTAQDKRKDGGRACQARRTRSEVRAPFAAPRTLNRH